MNQSVQYLVIPAPLQILSYSVYLLCVQWSLVPPDTLAHPPHPQHTQQYRPQGPLPQRSLLSRLFVQVCLR